MTQEEREKFEQELAGARRPKRSAAWSSTAWYYADYQAVNGVLLPHKIQRSIDGKPTEEMVFELKVNPKIDAKKFQAPSRGRPASMHRVLIGLRVVLASMVTPGAAVAQARRGRLIVTVVRPDGRDDSLGDGLVTAHDAGRAPRLRRSRSRPTTRAWPRRRARRRALHHPGTFPGFDTVTLHDVRVRGGDVRRRVTLQISKFDQQVTVARDAQSASLDPGGAAFSTVLTREQIDALPDDPGRDGGGAQGDGAAGGDNPRGRLHRRQAPAEVADPIDPPAQMDMFAAQNHGGMSGAMHIDIMTMPGNGPLRGNLDVNFMDEALNARNAFSPEKGAEQIEHTASACRARSGRTRRRSRSTAASARSTRRRSSWRRCPSGDTRPTASGSPATRTTSARASTTPSTRTTRCGRSFDRTWSESRNLGVGAYDLVGRAYQSDSSGQHAAAVGERAARPPDVHRVAPAAAVVGHEQRVGGRAADHPRERRVHRRRRAAQGRPAQLRRRVRHRPRLRPRRALVAHGRAGRGRALPLGRHLELPRHLHVREPRGVPTAAGRRTSRSASAIRTSRTRTTRRLLRAGRLARLAQPAARRASASGCRRTRAVRSTSRPASRRRGRRCATARSRIRGSYGDFYDWIAGSLYKQTLLVDGVRLQDINIVNPSWPDPGAGGAAAPSNQYLWSDAWCCRARTG